MKFFRSTILSGLIALYGVAALAAGAARSDPGTAIAALASLLAYAYVRWRRFSARLDLLAGYFLFFAVPVVLAVSLPAYVAGLMALPLLWPVDRSLLRVGETEPGGAGLRRRTLTRTGIVLTAAAAANALIALFLDNMALLISSGMAVTYLAVNVGVAAFRLTRRPVEADPVEERALAGSRSDVRVALRRSARCGGTIHIDPVYDWLNLESNKAPLAKAEIALHVSIVPPLAGPSSIVLPARVVDERGLLQTPCSLDLMRLDVIPRARYAEWLARKYLESTKPGNLPLIANVSTVKAQQGMRRGIEYYGSQEYQPGDSLRAIDWKHSAKYNELISKEFIEFSGQPATMLVNLTVTTADEADVIANRIVTTALSLAQSQIPTVIAAYDHKVVRLVSPVLQLHQIVVQALQLIAKISQVTLPAKHLRSMDISRLRANVSRLGSAGGDTCQTLLQLLRIEYDNVVQDTAQSPALAAIKRAERRHSGLATVVVVSGQNHDANALEMSKASAGRKGYAFVMV